MAMEVHKIVSGGQTGVDRAALNVALDLELPHGGWCPRGRLAEDGRIPRRYRLKETPTADYAERTERNVVDSDGTLILYASQMTGGTELTFRLCQKHGRPVLAIDLDEAPDADRVLGWLEKHRIGVLNVAGPRASTTPGIEQRAEHFLSGVLERTTLPQRRACGDA
jgi:hypothetical protein